MHPTSLRTSSGSITPSTTKRANMLDNLGGGAGRLPDAALRKRMAEYIDSLPA